MPPVTERYRADLLGVLSCYDRMIITGTLPGACYAVGMTSFLYSRHIKIFDYAKVFADPWRERLRQCAHELADKQGVAIEHVNKPQARRLYIGDSFGIELENTATSRSRQPRFARFTKRAGKWSCSSNGSSSIYVSRSSTAIQRMR